MGGRVVKMDQGMLGQPPVMLGLVGTEIIEDDVKLLFRVLCHDLIHEVQKLPAPAARIVSHFYHASSHFKSSEQCGSAMAFVFVIEPPECLPVRKTKPSLGPLKGLNGRLFV